MGRPRKNPIENSETEEAVDSKDTSALPTLSIDIHQLVQDVKGRYSAKEKGLADDLALGNEIRLSDDDDDYILSETVSKWWGPLTGIRGVPFGRIVQIAGKADAGKSTTAMLFMKAAQEAGVLVILWDSEKKFDVNRYNENIGGDSSILVTTRSKNIVDGAKQVAWYVRAAKEQNPDIKILIVWDSVGATMNTAEDDDEEDDFSTQPGKTAKEVGWAIKKFNKLIERYRNLETGKETIAVLCVNQVYQLIGSVGSKEKGGETLYYLSSIILQLSRKSDLNRIHNKQKMKYGIVSRAKVRKNHLFGGKECVAELNLVVSAAGIQLEDEVKGVKGIVGWDEKDE